MSPIPPLPPLPTVRSNKPHPLMAPIDMSRVHDEKGVKAKIKALLNFHGWYTWMPSANGYGQQGVLDHMAFKDGVLLVIEAKFKYNKPSAMQKQFAGSIIANSGFAFCVNETNIDHLAWWLESFEYATMCNSHEPALEVPPEHGARMLNAVSALTDLWGEAPSA